MARPGISYADVEKIAQQIQGQEHIPTIDRIRQLLGTGSSSTIAAHLRTWKARQDETYRIASKEKLPEELVALLKGLWGRVIDQADQKIESLKATTQEKVGLEQAILQYQKQQIVLEADAKQFEASLNDKQSQLNELQKINQQIQQNLEHYRASVREQRAKEQQQYEQQIKQPEQTHGYLLQDNHDLKKSLTAKLITHEQLSRDYQQLQQELLVITQQQLELLKQKYSDKENQFNDLSDQNKQLAQEQWILEQEKDRLSNNIKNYAKLIDDNNKNLPKHS